MLSKHSPAGMEATTQAERNRLAHSFSDAMFSLDDSCCFNDFVHVLLLLFSPSLRSIQEN